MFPFPSYGGGAWKNDTTAIEAVASEGGHVKFWKPFEDPAGTALVNAWDPPTGVFEISGGGDRWIAITEGEQRESLLIGSLGAIPRAGFGHVAADGTIAFKTIYQSDRGVTIVPPWAVGRWPPKPNAVWPTDVPDGWIMVPDAFPVDIQALPGGRAIWRGGAYGRAAVHPYYSDAMGVQLVRVGSEDFLLYWSNARAALVFQPDGAMEGYILETDGQGFNSHVIGGTQYATIVWSKTQGEAPQDLVKLHVNRQGVQFLIDWHPARPVPTWGPLTIPLPVLTRATWITWFEFAQGPTAPGNGHLLVRGFSGPIAKPFILAPELEGKVSGQVLGAFCGGSTVEEIETHAREVAAAGYRPVAYWDSRVWPRWPSLPPGSWLCLQAYCRNGEPPAAFEASLRGILRDAPDLPIVLVCQQYTSNASLTSDIKPLIPVFLTLANEFARIVALAPFSGYGRATGYNDHPEIYGDWETIRTTTRTPPFIPYTGGSVVPPKITITSYDPTTGTAPLVVTAVYAKEAGSGPIDQVKWWTRQLGTSTWTLVATNPPDDPDHHYHFDTAGTYEIKLTAIGPGGEGSTGVQRLVTVYADTPQPQPPPSGKIPPISDDQIVELTTIYDGTAPAQRKNDHDYLRDGCYYGLGYARNRTIADHPRATSWYKTSAEADAYYSATPPGMFTDGEVQDVSSRFTSRYQALGRYQQQSRRDNNRDQTYWAIVYARQREQGQPHEAALQEMERQMAAEAGQPDPYPPPPAGPVSDIRIENRRFKSDNQWWAWRGVSDFNTTAYVLQSNYAAMDARFDVYQRAKRTIVRTMAMLNWNGYAFSPRSVGYWSALDTVYHAAIDRGMNLELCLFADAQQIVPDVELRKAWLQQFADFIIGRPGIVPQLANEPFKNGWTGATDPALLELADLLAERLGHRHFSIGDPQDGDDPDASAETTAALVELSHHSLCTVMHPSRAEGDSSRWRRWVDHLEGFTDVIHQQAPGTALSLDEPMGAALTYQSGRRDNDPDAHIAAEMVAKCCGFGYTYHYLCEEVPDAAQLPGLLAMAPFIDQVPVDPGWSYRNDSWDGSPTHGYRVTGKDGKVRSMVNGSSFWTVAYGELDFGSINWVRPPQETVYDGARCKIYRG